MKILVTGGAGYIGSHTALKLIELGHEVTILDNMERGRKETLDLIKKYAGDFEFLHVDLRDLERLCKTLSGKKFDAVIHFAAYALVKESTDNPVNYMTNNVMGSQNLFQTLLDYNMNNVIFSSSAAVYGTPDQVPIKETAATRPESPYGTSKLIMEMILKDYCTFKGMNAVSLRYFNPAGSYKGLIGERHLDETHIIPRLLHAFLDSSFKFTVFGTDYETSDGTAVRDYVHILDLVDAHLKAIDYLKKHQGYEVFNVATGQGSSIKEVISSAEKVTGKKMEYQMGPRRPGDPAILVCDHLKIKEKMAWQAQYLLKDIIQSAWEFETKRPASDYSK